jgi:uncharacterized protein
MMQPIDYSRLDRPEILNCLFHPRPEWGQGESASTAADILIPVDEDIHVGARFHLSDISAPNILFFHGNGEIVADYDELGDVYNRMGINFLPVDYRGYGRSNGLPTVSAMMRDCHAIFDFVTTWLRNEGYTGPMILKGRSLGSASALELASGGSQRASGLIIESGFAHEKPLLELLGVDVERLELESSDGFDNIRKIASFEGPTLIIHAARDHIIPFSDGQALFDGCGSRKKRLLEIPHANHNNLFAMGLSEYLEAVRGVVEETVR